MENKKGHQHDEDDKLKTSKYQANFRFSSAFRNSLKETKSIHK